MYEVIVPDRIEKRLNRLPQNVYERVLRTIRSLAGEPRPRGCGKMTGEESWRVRVGDYRIVHDVDDGQRRVTVLKVAHRPESYR